jgi:hypothetical protein
MRIPIMEGTLEQCRSRAKKMIDRHDGPVTELGEDEWELETPDDAGSIGDNDGILRIIAKGEEDAVSATDVDG